MSLLLGVREYCTLQTPLYVSTMQNGNPQRNPFLTTSFTACYAIFRANIQPFPNIPANPPKIDRNTPADKIPNNHRRTKPRFCPFFGPLFDFRPFPGISYRPRERNALKSPYFALRRAALPCGLRKFPASTLAQ